MTNRANKVSNTVDALYTELLRKSAIHSIESVFNFYTHKPLLHKNVEIPLLELEKRQECYRSLINLDGKYESIQCSLFLDDQFCQHIMLLLLGNDSAQSQRSDLQSELCDELLNQICGILKEDVRMNGEPFTMTKGSPTPTNSQSNETIILSFHLLKFRISYLVLQLNSNKRS